MKNIEKENKGKLLSVMLIVALIALVSMTVVLWKTETKSPATGEFVPPALEEHAVKGVPEVPENLGYSPLDIPGAYTAALCGRVVEEEGSTDIWFTNDADNTVWMKLRMLDERGNILGETGLLKPGEYVQSIDFSDSGIVLQDGMGLQLKIMAYEPDTYYSAGSAVLNTTLEMQ